MKFGKMYKKLRDKKGYGLRECARLAKFDPCNFSKIEKGQIRPPQNKETLMRLINVVTDKKSEATKLYCAACFDNNIIPSSIKRSFWLLVENMVLAVEDEEKQESCQDGIVKEDE